MSVTVMPSTTHSVTEKASSRRRPVQFAAQVARASVQRKAGDEVARAGQRGGRAMSLLLWGVQGLLALEFLFAGGMKLVLPIEELTAQMPLPGLLVRGIGVVE